MTFFLVPQQCALDTSRMHGYAKTLVNQACQCARLHRGVCVTRFADEIQNCVGELVGLLGSALARDQAGQSDLLECRLRLIEGRP